MVENPVKAKGELIDVVLVDNVGFRDRRIAPVVGDVLRAGECAGLGESG